MRVLSILFITVIAFSNSLSADIEAFNSKADAFLQKYVVGNNVNYETACKSDMLPELLVQIDQINYEELSDLEKQAFIVNAYNIFVIHSVGQNLPTKSVMDISKFFDTENHNFSGMQVSLNSLEKKMLYRSFPDPRFHFVLVCGAVDCPPIANYAYTADKLEEQLEERTRMALNDPSFIKVTDEGTQISKIFEWYASDFGGSKNTIADYINAYRDESISTDFSYYEYDWSLNDYSSDTGLIMEASDVLIAEAISAPKKK